LAQPQQTAETAEHFFRTIAATLERTTTKSKMAESPFLASANTNTISQGSIWAVLVQPSFPDMVFEASALMTKGAPSQANPTTGAKASQQPSEFSVRMKEAAEAITVANTGPAEREESEDEQMTHDDAVENREQETEESKEAKRKLVEELWSKLQPSCFVRTDDRGQSLPPPLYSMRTGLQISAPHLLGSL
jgi:hypothetical protein